MITTANASASRCCRGEQREAEVTMAARIDIASVTEREAVGAGYNSSFRLPISQAAKPRDENLMSADISIINMTPIGDGVKLNRLAQERARSYFSWIGLTTRSRRTPKVTGLRPFAICHTNEPKF